MESKSIDFLKRLVEAPSPSGFEGEAVRVWRQEAETFADSVRTTVHGNTILTLNPGGKPRVMLAGHIDEIGLMVQSVDQNGFLRISGIGGWDPQILPGQRVKIITKSGPVLGVIGKKPIHLMEPEERKKAVEMDSLWVDIGAKNKEEALSLVSIGDPAVVDAGFVLLRNNNAVARGFDDRIGAFVVLEAARILAQEGGFSAEVCAVATVQEEVGLRGARTAAYELNPDVGIAVDVTFSTDYPGMEGKQKARFGDIKLGGGPVIARGPNINPVVFERLLSAAKELGISYVVEAIPRGTGTDANAIQITRAGVAAGLVSIPNRYMHTPVEMVNLDDVANAARLLAAFIKALEPDASFIPY